MKNRIISGASLSALGLLIAFGPQFIFKPCGIMGDSYSHCHWSIQGDMAAGMMIAALGACLFVFSEAKTRFGLSIGIFLSGIIALIIPNGLIGGCSSMAMACHKAAFPALSVYSLLVIIGALANMAYLELKPRLAPR
ncbi:hypothetical protein FACS1894109_06880 [Spirochaetia bacterium]|nr:hypothetical protein FACS1894109_06880 [Spirochaetia bacterium]